MVIESTEKLNFFPNTNEVSKHYNPRIILNQEILDYNCYCTYILGDYILAHEELEPTNINVTLALNYISLHPTVKKHGSLEFLHVQTNRIITRRRCTRVPITPAIIK